MMMREGTAVRYRYRSIWQLVHWHLMGGLLRLVQLRGACTMPCHFVIVAHVYQLLITVMFFKRFTYSTQHLLLIFVSLMCNCHILNNKLIYEYSLKGDNYSSNCTTKGSNAICVRRKVDIYFHQDVLHWMLSSDVCTEARGLYVLSCLTNQCVLTGPNV